jgi:hypothetical protein
MSSHPAARVRSDPNVAAEVIRVDDLGLDDLRLAVLAHIGHILSDVDHVTCRLDRHGSDVTVHLAGPGITEMRRRAVAVRVLDAVRSMGRTFGHVDVEYEARPNDAPDDGPDTNGAATDHRGPGA